MSDVRDAGDSRTPVVPPLPNAADWEAALLSSDTEALIAAVRNYLGPVRTPYDKRVLVARLSAFLRREDTRKGVLALLDPLDARILGALLVAGPLAEPELRNLFSGELPLFDLGIRIANLLDRLIVFRWESAQGKLLAVNPLLAEPLAGVVLEAGIVFGLEREGGCFASPAEAEAARACAVSAETALALFLCVYHAPGSIRKGGDLTKRAAERVAGLVPGLVVAEEGGAGRRLEAVVRAFAAAGLWGDARDRVPDVGSLGALIAAWGEALPIYLAVCLGRGTTPGDDADEAALPPVPAIEEEARLVAAALAAAPPLLVFSRGGLARWMALISLRFSRLCAARDRVGSRPRGFEPASMERLFEALSAFGLLAPLDGGFLVAVPSAGAHDRLPAPDPASTAGRPVLVAEGSHVLHLLPEAGLAARLSVGGLARPVSFGAVWSFEVDRESARRGFAAGRGAKDAIAALESLAGRALPQSLAFSIQAWEEEYRSLRLYHGFVLVADERRMRVIERSPLLSAAIVERLAPGVYVLAVSSEEEAAALLRAAGLEPPPEARRAGPPVPWEASRARIGELDGQGESGAARRAAEAAAPLAALAARRGSSVPLDPGAYAAALKVALARLSDDAQEQGGARRSPEVLRELAERIDRRIVLSEQQLLEADVHAERIEAAGLDYLGKVRVVEHALRHSGDRLELLYRLPGSSPERTLVRPVRLDKTDKGLVLEAEDLATGSPIRIPLGAMSSVKRMRASLFGEGT